VLVSNFDIRISNINYYLTLSVEPWLRVRYIIQVSQLIKPGANGKPLMSLKTPIAVVGIGGIFPGADSIDTFWRNIINKVETVADIPQERWIATPDQMIREGHAPDKAYSRKACLIKDFQFDPRDIDIDAEFIQSLDPLYPLVLHAGRAAWEDCRTHGLNKDRVGVSLAAIALPTEASSAITRKLLGRAMEEKLFGSLPPPDGPLQSNDYFATRVTGLPGALLARALNFGGGSFTLDAACASSLYAIKLACDRLQSGEIDAMLAGGVSRPDCLYTQVGFSQLRALSPSGRCAPFDRRADGLVVGEGAGILVLKRLPDALDHGDRIYGLIRGMGLSNDMRGDLLAPDVEGQLRAMRAAYRDAGWQPTDVDLIECHGAGTPVGDATELKSLHRLRNEADGNKKKCAIGSVKSMIGHLLTGAGAAGAIKTLLALHHGTLPPSANFQSAPTDSPLESGPFRVQTDAQPWVPRAKGKSLRAAVSAFGFGGINGHLLLEQWAPERSGRNHSIEINHRPAPEPHAVAIVGMATHFGNWDSLRAFQEGLFNGRNITETPPSNRFKSCDRELTAWLGKNPPAGGYVGAVSVDIGEFHIPPKEIPDILPQHLMMLKTAAASLEDAGLPLRSERPRMGAIIGMGFDFEATDFHLRWYLHRAVEKWNRQYGLGLDPAALDQWLRNLQDQSGPPLTASRTLGALGSMIASRVAREFGFGGPSFTVSAEAVSGIKALEIGVNSLRQNETDAVLVGAVDMAGDLRELLLADAHKAMAEGDKALPFDLEADGTLPGEGAAALVLKRFEDAVTQGHRIYAVIKGLGTGTGGQNESATPSSAAYRRVLGSTLDAAGVQPRTIEYFECHGSGNPDEDDIEARALEEVFRDREFPCALGSAKANIGHIGAAAGLASLVKTALCIHREIIPPLSGFTHPENHLLENNTRFHLPRYPQFWVRNRVENPRRACVASMAGDGNISHVLLEGYEGHAPESVKNTTRAERRHPLGWSKYGLFAATGSTPEDLLNNLDRLTRFVAARGESNPPMELLARQWHAEARGDVTQPHAVTMVAENIGHLKQEITNAAQAVRNNRSPEKTGPSGVYFTPEPMGPDARLAFVFPGSGNHYLGMGRRLGVYHTDIMRTMDAGADELRSQMLPEIYMPWRSSWRPGWEPEARATIAADPLNMIFGQVMHGCVTAQLMQTLGLRPAAALGYSLGECSALFALGAWPDRGEMLARMRATDLFRTQLAGPCHAVRAAWDIDGSTPLDWRVAVVNRSAAKVRRAIQKFPHARLLIVNTPDECVIGGLGSQVQALIEALACQAVFLEGIITVHCDAVLPVRKAYYQLHHFPISPRPEIQFYSCAAAAAYEPTPDGAAQSILDQAVQGFDFTALICQAHADGVRIFVEMGPRSSCTRMIRRILTDKPHLAVSVCHQDEDDHLTILKCLARLISEGVPVDLDRLYGDETRALIPDKGTQKDPARTIVLPTGGQALLPTLPQGISDPEATIPPVAPETGDTTEPPSMITHFQEIIDGVADTSVATARAHATFLDLANDLTTAYGRTFNLQARLLEKRPAGARIPTPPPAPLEAPSDPVKINTPTPPAPAFDRDMCLEFAVGSAARVLGPEFAVVDSYEARVRLPDEPLMLADRILSIEGEKLSLGPGRIVTEHDVLAGAWYLDGGRAPVCISVEAGQADLFLCSYLGIDHQVKGERTYRLLDATVRFHRELPRPGDTIRYEIRIDKFVRQGETYLFFFNFKGSIGSTPLITMTNGCAGFFTPGEMKNSGGIILTEEEMAPLPVASDFSPPVPVTRAAYDEAAVSALRRGELAGCFGSNFDGVALSPSLWLPDGRMHLLDRVLELDPKGGRYGLGLIRAEADIHPDDWFLTCHFMDDRVMPGTLMYECCAHSLRIFLQRLGWVSDNPDVWYGPVKGVESRLKCRGPVTPETAHVIYEVQIKEIGYRPEPYVFADAHMYADGHHIVMFEDMAMQMNGVTQAEIEALWNQRSSETVPAPTTFSQSQLLEFAQGQPSKAFGPEYRAFDEDRFIARLPRPPYLFIDRIASAEPQPWVLAPGGWIEAEYRVPDNAWYFAANRIPFMPYAVLLEIALQPCGWLAAYMGSALHGKGDLHFRNLGGRAAIHYDVTPGAGMLTTRARMTQVSEAAGMIIQTYDFEILQSGQPVYSGDTYFGFFTPEALAQQTGIRDAHARIPGLDSLDTAEHQAYRLEDTAPRTPADVEIKPLPDKVSGMAAPAKALRMNDAIETILPDGGPAGLGFIRGTKEVDPDEWFFRAHFYRDPVCPGSLGIESFYQLLKVMATRRWPQLADTHYFSLVAGTSHQWIYRGQIVPHNKKVTVEAAVTMINDKPVPGIWADGFLKVDGLHIYEMKNFGLQLLPLETE
jgi:PfaB family protein